MNDETLPPERLPCIPDAEVIVATEGGIFRIVEDDDGELIWQDITP